MEGFEPSTPALRKPCSATELHRRSDIYYTSAMPDVNLSSRELVIDNATRRALESCELYVTAVPSGSDAMISSRELVNAALDFQQVPRVPYCVAFTVHARETLLADAHGRQLLEKVDNDMMIAPIIRIEFGGRRDDGTYEDEFGVVWDRRADPDIGIPKPVITPENFAEFKWPDPRAEGRFDALGDSIGQHADKFHCMALDFSLYERCWSLRGMENLLMDFAEQEDFVEALLDRVLQFNLDVIEAGLEACPNLDGVYFGDDFGSQMGLIMGAERWRRVLKPRLAKQYGAVKSADKKVIIHSCGCVQEVFDDLVEIGVNCFNPFQPEVMDVFAIHEQYHGKMAFWGGISTQQLLPYGTVAEVEQQVDKLLEMGRKGGYIIAPAHATPGDAKCENLIAMLENILGQ